MKRFFITLTAILLCIGAFAQSGATLKGDVNGDGKVDVEDVTSVVDIILSGKTYGYFYFGTTEPTAGNFTSLPGAVASYTSIGEAVGATVSIAEGETLYMLCPAAWMKGKHVDVEDGEGNSYDFVEDTDAGSISGYVIYKTQAFNEATDAILKFNNSSAETYYWYVGQTQPNSLDGLPTVSEYTSPFEYTNTSDARGYVYILLHNSKSISSVIGKVSGGSGTFRIIDDTTIPDYNIWRTTALGSGSTWIITIE